MSEVTQQPTHYRLLNVLKAIGPYLREPQSKEGHYIFDCLSVCVNDKKSPEEREFWGWWLKLDKSEEGYSAKYNIGKYNTDGNWDSLPLPKKAVTEVSRTQVAFHKKLVDELQTKFEISVQFDEESVEFI
ncbi:sigma factor-binding protein Crl [Vibrio sp. ECSMB14106]|uniref:sigma factor-binding protein Crl n=1 Tax=Vibrio sp. ECSMB14106 TaxID=1638949 RepID=UPI000619B0C7|nr:sigma factor-binding protein Crl [Vibrio sp. ECSMB14106]